jgi:site-specific DNA recombinase
MSETAILYIRVSDEKQIDNTSLDEQERRGRQYCENHGITLLQIFREEAQTAKLLERPKLQEALKFCSAHKVDCFIVYKLDRLSRNVGNHHIVKAVLAKFRIRLVSMSENCDDTPSGRLLENMLASVAQFDNEVRAERTVSGMQSRIRQGCFPFTAPIGYKENPEKPGIKVRDPATFDLVQKALLSVIYEGKHSVDAIRMLNEHGVKTARGSKVTASLFSRMVQNKFYAGVVEGMGITAEGKHEAMITVDEWHKMQEVVIGHSNTVRMKKETFSETFWLNKAVLCSGCGYPISGAWAKQKGRYGYYSCRKGFCARKDNIRKVDLEVEFMKLLKGLTPTAACARAFQNCLMEKVLEAAKDSATIREKLKDEVANLRSRLVKLEDSFLDGTFDKERYKDRSEVIKSEISIKEIQANQSNFDLVETRKAVDYDIRFLQLLPTFYSSLVPADCFKLNWLLFPKGLRLENGKVTTPEISPIYKQMQPFEDDSGDVGMHGVPDKELIELLEDFKTLYHTVREFKGIRQLFEIPEGIKNDYHSRFNM